MGITRKLNDIRKALHLMATQGNTVQFLNNADNAQKLNDLVEDIHEAVIDYQVCAPQALVLITSHMCFRLPCNRILLKKPASSL